MPKKCTVQEISFLFRRNAQRELVFASEEEFDLSLSEISEADEDMFAGKLKTVGDLVRYLEARVEE